VLSFNSVFAQVFLECRLKPTWDWLIAVMDSTEAQLRFGSVLSESTDPSHPSHPLHVNFVKTARNNRDEVRLLQAIDSRRRNRPVDGLSNRRDFLTYVLSLMRSHNDEHADSLPTLDIAALKHVAYMLDALVYYMRSGTDPDADMIRDGISVGSWQDNEENINDFTEDDPVNQSVAMETDSMDGDSDVGGKGGRKHSFFHRSDSTSFLGCVAPDPFQTPLVEALPLADQPHLLQPNSRKEDLFRMPQQALNQWSDYSKQPSPFDQLPIRMALSTRSATPVEPPVSSTSNSSVIVRPHEMPNLPYPHALPFSLAQDPLNLSTSVSSHSAPIPSSSTSSSSSAPLPPPPTEPISPPTTQPPVSLPMVAQPSVIVHSSLMPTEPSLLPPFTLRLPPTLPTPSPLAHDPSKSDPLKMSSPAPEVPNEHKETAPLDENVSNTVVVETSSSTQAASHQPS
jgi:E3 ubiquitin-protein ligase EDD1